MKITVDLPESDLEEISRITGIFKKGPAIRKMLRDTLAMQRRAEVAAKFLSGEWSAELEGYEEGRISDHAHTTNLAEQWRD